MSQQHASVSQGRICHSEVEAADHTFYHQTKHTDTGPISPSADPIKPGASQGNHWRINAYVTGPGKRSTLKAVVVVVGWLLNVPATG